MPHPRERAGGGARYIAWHVETEAALVYISSDHRRRGWAWTLDYKEEWPLDAPGFVHVDLCTGLQILVTRDSGSGGAADSSEPSVVRASAGEKAEEAGDSRRAGEKARRGLGFSGRVGLGADRTTAYCSCVCRCRVKLSQPRRRGLRRLAIRKPLNRATMRVAAA